MDHFYFGILCIERFQNRIAQGSKENATKFKTILIRNISLQYMQK